MPGQLGEQVLETLLDSAVANENPDVGLKVEILMQFENSISQIVNRLLILL